MGDGFIQPGEPGWSGGQPMTSQELADENESHVATHRDGHPDPCDCWLCDLLRRNAVALRHLSETERERDEAQAATVAALRSVLRVHWLTGVVCDHEAETDTANCWCALWSSGAKPSVGEAVEAWITHVLEAVALKYPQAIERLVSAKAAESERDALREMLAQARAEAQHWQSLVSRADIAQFPFNHRLSQKGR